MSKFHLLCCCIVCKKQLTVQSLSAHIKSHTTNSCLHCGAPTKTKFCSKSCSAKYCNARKDYTKIKTGPPKGTSPSNKGIKKIKPPLIKTCPICSLMHSKEGQTCCRICRNALISAKIKQSIFNGFTPNQNRGRGKQSYLESSFEKWINKSFPNLEYIAEQPFRRMDVTKTYFADFFFPSKQLIIELDGSQHIHTKEYDDERDNYIKSTYNVKILRISHKEYKSKSRLVEIWSLLSESNR